MIGTGSRLCIPSVRTPKAGAYFFGPSRLLMREGVAAIQAPVKRPKKEHRK